MIKLKKLVGTLAETAGLTLDGDRPYDPQIRDTRFYRRVLSDGSLGLGEAYMEGWWDCADLSEFFHRILSSDLQSTRYFGALEHIRALRAQLLNMQSIGRAEEMARIHYDLGNEFYEGMLDRRMVYSCGYWSQASELNSAQENKLDLVCRKLGLTAGDRVLDIGCGWGSFTKFAAERYGCVCVGITNSREQAIYAQKVAIGLSVEIYNVDYREFSCSPNQFTKVVSLGMLEHVGPKNYKLFLSNIERALTRDGLCLIQTIGDNQSAIRCDPWLDRYIFRGGVAPSIQQLGLACENLFVVEDFHNFGPDYYLTLMAWRENFVRNWQPDLVRCSLASNEFRRMWDYYLQSFASAFKARHLQLWQLVLSKPSGIDGYRSLR